MVSNALTEIPGTGRRFRYAHGDLGVSLNYSKSPQKRGPGVKFWYVHALSTLRLRFCYDPTTTMKIRLRLVYADGAAVATLPRPRRWSYAFVAILIPLYIKSTV